MLNHSTPIFSALHYSISRNLLSTAMKFVSGFLYITSTNRHGRQFLKFSFICFLVDCLRCFGCGRCRRALPGQNPRHVPRPERGLELHLQVGVSIMIHQEIVYITVPSMMDGFDFAVSPVRRASSARSRDL